MKADLPAQEAPPRQGARLPRPDEDDAGGRRVLAARRARGRKRLDGLTDGRGTQRAAARDALPSAGTSRRSRAGTTRSHPLLTARFLRTDLETTRFGLATGRKLGGAVVRNRVRRRLREALRVMAPSFQPGWDVLIIARPAIVEADHDALVGALRRTPRPGRRARRAFGHVKHIGIGLIKLYRIVFAWLPSELSVRADLLPLHRAGHREIRPPARQLDGRQADRPLPSVESGRLRPCSLTRLASRDDSPPGGPGSGRSS